MTDRVHALRARFHELLLGPYLASTCEQVAMIVDENRVVSPTVLTRRTYNAAREATVRVYRALTTACERILVDVPLRRHLGLGPQLDELLALDREHGEGSLMVRLDAFVGTDGVCRFIEANCMTPGALPLLADGFAELPITRALAQEFSFTTVTPYRYAPQAVAQVMAVRGRSTPPVIAIISAEPTTIERFWLPYVAHREGWTVMRVAPSELAFESGELRARDVVVDFVAMPSQDSAARAAAAPAFEALRTGAVRFPHGFARSLPPDYKSTFEVLSSPEHAHLFDIETQRLLATHVPWTRVLRDRKTTYAGSDVDLLPFITANRERFVIKPSGGLAGAGVVLGWGCTEAAWQRALKIARAVQCVVQERVDAGPEEVYFRRDPPTGAIRDGRYTVDLDPIVWNGVHADGAVTRIAVDGLHNQAAGGLGTALWVLDD